MYFFSLFDFKTTVSRCLRVLTNDFNPKSMLTAVLIELGFTFCWFATFLMDSVEPCSTLTWMASKVIFENYKEKIKNNYHIHVNMIDWLIPGQVFGSYQVYTYTQSQLKLFPMWSLTASRFNANEMTKNYSTVWIVGHNPFDLIIFLPNLVYMQL